MLTKQTTELAKIASLCPGSSGLMLYGQPDGYTQAVIGIAIPASYHSIVITSGT